MTASNAPDRSVTDDALASGGPSGDGGFDPSRPFTTRDGRKVRRIHIWSDGRIIGEPAGLMQTTWFSSSGHHEFGNHALDLVNTPACPAVHGEVMKDGPATNAEAAWMKWFDDQNSDAIANRDHQQSAFFAFTAGYGVAAQDYCMGFEEAIRKIEYWSGCNCDYEHTSGVMKAIELFREILSEGQGGRS